jgi:hypothetical protein
LLLEGKWPDVMADVLLLLLYLVFLVGNLA